MLKQLGKVTKRSVRRLKHRAIGESSSASGGVILGMERLRRLSWAKQKPEGSNERVALTESWLGKRLNKNRADDDIVDERGPAQQRSPTTRRQGQSAARRKFGNFSRRDRPSSHPPLELSVADRPSLE
jgi:hypothetical protein